MSNSILDEKNYNYARTITASFLTQVQNVLDFYEEQNIGINNSSLVNISDIPSVAQNLFTHLAEEISLGNVTEIPEASIVFTKLGYDTVAAPEGQAYMHIIPLGCLGSEDITKYVMEFKGVGLVYCVGELLEEQPDTVADLFGDAEKVYEMNNPSIVVSYEVIGSAAIYFKQFDVERELIAEHSDMFHSSVNGKEEDGVVWLLPENIASAKDIEVNVPTATSSISTDPKTWN